MSGDLLNKAVSPTERLQVILATWFGAGLLPRAPGTWGSLAALPFGWLLLASGSPTALVLAIVILFPLGVWAAAGYERLTGREDAGPIVIDEVLGQWIALLPLAWLTATGNIFGDYLFAFAAFRLFDIWKPWPICLLDQRLKGGLGVMADDILAGAYAAALMVLLGRVI